MKYWVYSGGQIYGPHPKEGLSSVPGFGAHSLVCPEGVAGDKPGDWSTAETVKELASVLMASVGASASHSTGAAAKPPASHGAGLPSSFSSEPDFGILSGSGSYDFNFESLPGALRETPAESALSSDVKSYLQELNLKDRRIVSLEEELREAQQVFEKYQGEIARILDDNRRTFEQVHTHLTQKDMALEQASQKITTLEDSLKLTRRPDQTLSETLLEMKQEADQLRTELERTRGELARVKEAPAAAMPAVETPKVEEPKPVADDKAKGGLKLGFKGGLGGLKPIGLGGGPGAKPPLLKPSLGARAPLGLKPAAKPALEAPAPAPQAQLPAPAAAAPAPTPAPVSPAPSAQSPAPVVERPTLPPLDLVISPLQIPMPSWEAAAQPPIELSFPGTASAPASTPLITSAAAPDQPAGLAFRIPKRNLGVAGAPVDLKPAGTPATPGIVGGPTAKPLSFAPPAAEPAPFTLTRKTLGAAAVPGAPPAAKPLSFVPPAAPPPATTESTVKAVEDIFAAPQAAEPAALPPFTLTKKTLGAAGAPGTPVARPLSFVPPAAPETTLKAVEDIFAAAPAAPPIFTLTKKTLGAPAQAPAPGVPAAKPLSFKLPSAAPAVEPLVSAAPPAAVPPAFTLTKKTLGVFGAPGAPKKIAFNPALVPPAPAAPAPQAPPAFQLTRKTLGPAAAGPTLAAGPVAKPLSFKPSALPPLPDVPQPRPVEVIPEPVFQAPPVVEAPPPVVEMAPPAVEAPPAKSPLEEALAGLSTVEVTAPPPVVSEVEAPARSPLEEAMASIQEAAAPVVEPPAARPAPIVLPAAVVEAPVPAPVAAAKPMEAAPAKPEIAKTTVLALAPAKKEEPAAAAAAPAKKKRSSTIVMAVIVALVVVAGVVTTMMIVKGIKEDLAPVVTMPELNGPVPGGQNYSLPAPNPAPQQPASTPPSTSPGTQSQAPAAAPGTTPDRMAEPIQDAVRFVKTFRLDPGRGTIANWFDSQFLTTPGEGKEPEWSAVHLEDTKFTVQYRLSYTSKSASMPDISYVFEVDLAAKSIKGSNEAARVLLAGGKAPSRSPQQRAGGVAGVDPAGQSGAQQGQPPQPPVN